jgi:hypothetical protein
MTACKIKWRTTMGKEEGGRQTTMALSQPGREHEIQIIEFSFARTLRGFCENENFLFCTSARRKILTRNGLSYLVRNITTRPCKTLFLQNLTGPKGGDITLKKGGRTSLLGSRHFLRDQNYFSTTC